MQCVICGKEINDSSNFCKYCGSPTIGEYNTSNQNANEDNRIELTDENGNTIYFEFLDLITYRNCEYVVLLPENEDADEVVILQVESLSDETENYISVEDQQILDAVFQIFKERNRDLFIFTD